MHFGSLINFLLLDLCCTGVFVVFFYLFVSLVFLLLLLLVGWFGLGF